jgi:hypothetical protein
MAIGFAAALPLFVLFRAPLRDGAGRDATFFFGLAAIGYPLKRFLR